MRSLGIRCSNSDFTYTVLEGSKKLPTLLNTGTVSYPRGFSKPQSLKWFYQEITELIKKNKIDVITINKFEGLAKGNSYEDRVEHEAMVLLAAENFKRTKAIKKVKSTIARDLGLKGRAKYLATFDTSPISAFDGLSPKSKESTLAAWSGLN